MKKFGDEKPHYLKDIDVLTLEEQEIVEKDTWTTLFISGGRRDKISKGDIAGLFIKQGKLKGDQLGTIDLKQDCAFVAVPLALAEALVEKLNNSRLKKKKVRMYTV